MITATDTVHLADPHDLNPSQGAPLTVCNLLAARLPDGHRLTTDRRAVTCADCAELDAVVALARTAGGA
ncbi:hypothetical protein [Streptomyces triticirhizae]|uniref:Uncharacterized protein n=1 Tax=Streptomyces triticirhizae TaxID=2483353 RepID=A0A3M2M7A9_9ACTN|nr:hypothetical protein [Streptomyces triticirhizae]RMI44415.1 hypothetical protein EBN88_05285 [Streptomyces triticirhizae]